MNVSLFNPNLAVCLGVLTAVSIALLLERLVKKRYVRLCLSLALVSIALALVLNLILRNVFPSDVLPTLLWLKLLPGPLSFGILVLALIVARGGGRGWRKANYTAWASITVLIAFCFSLVLANMDYHYYPTLGSVFGRVQASDAADKSTPLYNSRRTQPASIESSLYVTDKPTYHGRLEPLAIPGPISGFQARSGWIYVPAVAASAARVDLPVLVLMAGVPGNTYDWLNGGELVSSLNAFASAHHGITPLTFVVDNTGSFLNDTECVDSPRGNVETYLTRDVPTYIKAHYNVLRAPSAWGIGGLSMGGMCAAMLALRHTDIYHVFLDFSGEDGPNVGSVESTIATLFNGSTAAWQAHRLPTLLKRKYPDLKGYFVIGKNDDIILRDQTQQTYNAAKAAGIDVAYEALDGVHSFQIWSQAFKDALPWASNQLGATACTKQCY
jgi:S-formylglutathione hydrolase FrmB